MVCGFGFIFHKHRVVGGNTYSKNTKMGGRTHSAVPLRYTYIKSYFFKYPTANKKTPVKNSPVLSKQSLILFSFLFLFQLSFLF